RPKINSRSVAVAAVVTVFVAGAVSATAARAVSASSHGSRTGQIVQTLGTAALYGTSVPLGVAGGKASRGGEPAAIQAERLFTHRGSAPRSSVLPASLRPPSAAGLRVRTAAAGTTGFPGLTNRDQRLAGTGAYARSQPDLEPPDQGLCAGKGFVVEP